MTILHFHGEEIHTIGSPPNLGDIAPPVLLTTINLEPQCIGDFRGLPTLLYTFPSIDTEVCFKSLIDMHEVISSNEHHVNFASISMDLPFALTRVQRCNGLDRLVPLSDFKNRDFGDAYGLTIVDGAAAGLIARSIWILDKDGIIGYVELVDEISDKPNIQLASQQLLAMY